MSAQEPRATGETGPGSRMSGQGRGSQGGSDVPLLNDSQRGQRTADVLGFQTFSFSRAPLARSPGPRRRRRGPWYHDGRGGGARTSAARMREGPEAPIQLRRRPRPRSLWPLGVRRDPQEAGVSRSAPPRSDRYSVALAPYTGRSPAIHEAL